jgi:hypothetical protein
VEEETNSLFVFAVSLLDLIGDNRKRAVANLKCPAVLCLFTVVADDIHQVEFRPTTTRRSEQSDAPTRGAAKEATMAGTSLHIRVISIIALI